VITRYCIKCDYPLEGLGDARRCPECGQPFDPGNPATFLAFPRAAERVERRFDLLLILIGAGGVLLLIVAATLMSQFSGPLPGAPFALGIALILFAMGATIIKDMDLHWLLHWSLRREELLRNQGWPAICDWHQRRLRSPRVFVMWHDRITKPGSAALTQTIDARTYAAESEAEKLAVQTLANISARSGVSASQERAAAVEAYAMALLARGSYEAALAQGESLLQLGWHRHAVALAARVAYCRGRMSECQRLAREAIAASSEDGMQTLAMSLALTAKGDEAIATINRLIAQRDSVAGETMPDMLAAADAKPARRLQLLIHQRTIARRGGEPRLIAAMILLMNERLAQATARLDEAKGYLCRLPDMQLRYHGLRAVESAGLNRPDDAERELASMDRARTRLYGRQHAWEAHRLAAACHLTFQRFDLARESLQRAGEIVIHPIDRHYTSYWLARCAQLRGNPAAAVEHYRAVIADGFDTWFHHEAAASVVRIGKA